MVQKISSFDIYQFQILKHLEGFLSAFSILPVTIYITFNRKLEVLENKKNSCMQEIVEL